jgi:short subunit dehydrogenase-like uncharacterized protein
MNKEFDVIVFGATGYTGRLVAEHLLKTYGVNGSVKWAMAGRNSGKLVEVKGLLGAPSALQNVIADSDDSASLEAMASRAKVIISTAGPYQLYGSNLVAACAKTGTDYVDLTGESHWIAAMTAAHHERAKNSGARIVFSCGFDSIPVVRRRSRLRRRIPQSERHLPIPLRSHQDLKVRPSPTATRPMKTK